MLKSGGGSTHWPPNWGARICDILHSPPTSQLILPTYAITLTAELASYTSQTLYIKLKQWELRASRGLYSQMSLQCLARWATRAGILSKFSTYNLETREQQRCSQQSYRTTGSAAWIATDAIMDVFQEKTRPSIEGKCEYLPIWVPCFPNNRVLDATVSFTKATLIYSGGRTSRVERSIARTKWLPSYFREGVSESKKLSGYLQGQVHSLLREVDKKGWISLSQWPRETSWSSPSADLNMSTSTISCIVLFALKPSGVRRIEFSKDYHEKKRLVYWDVTLHLMTNSTSLRNQKTREKNAYRNISCKALPSNVLFLLLATAGSRYGSLRAKHSVSLETEIQT